ncbi:MAG: anti-sigma factor antagonist [Streptosporangiaceae bacterium]|nr:anti-sigma factor antagonist [Streptosporangiaceae bacterium]
MDLLTVLVKARESAGQPYTLVEIAGEADVTNTDELRRLLEEEVAQQPRTLIIDLSGLRFLDSSALHALLRVNRELDRQGGVLALVSPQPAVAKILRLTTADRLIPVFESVAAAAAGLSASRCLPRVRMGYASPSGAYDAGTLTALRCSRGACRRGTAFLLFPGPADDTVPSEVRRRGGRCMKIALVAQHATPLRPRAGSGPDSDDIGLTELTRKLAQQGHQVTLYAQKHHPDLPDEAALPDGARVEHITAGQLPPGPAARERGDTDLLQQVPAFSGPLRTRWLRDRPDVVHALRWTSGLAALAAARDLSIPVVQEFNSLGVAERRGRSMADSAAAARRRLEPAIGRSAAAVVATNSAEVSDLASLGVHRSSIRVVPWGVDTDTFAPEGPAAERNGRPRLLATADFSEREALQTLLLALTKVPGAELVIVGGPPRAELPRHGDYVDAARFSGKLGISDRVAFTGKVEYGALPALLRSADLVVSTCTYEPSGTTSLQAMACGTPVVAPPVGGHVDAVVDGTTGILVPPTKPALLAQRIRQLLAHPMLLEAYGVAAADRARSRYSWDRIAGETLAVYGNATAKAA